MIDEAGILEQIRKNLPQAVGETLKAELEALARFRSEIPNMMKIREELASVIKDFSAYKAKHAEIDKRESALAIGEANLAAKDRDFTLNTLHAELRFEKEKTQFCKDIALGLVRNVEYRSSVFTSQNKNHVVNGYPQSMAESGNTTETSTAG